MNILFFLTPKEDVAHVDEDDTMRQVLEKMEHHGYTAIPLLSREVFCDTIISERWKIYRNDHGGRSALVFKGPQFSGFEVA